ncbi:uncharacterized protein BKCO1_2600017 [Diplodia corticola]|uniref:Uncharacterized protein n=1 Tax=Diplodia corticola TaxID=236234 RepID=A0A1J9QY67_9PEZI|nr:uncharacterized protein BKCO1_2600017 [Diplodia corticola]OJD33990.1 hypothetical protein BKCO1_2600017 [Diplodia corticola]
MSGPYRFPQQDRITSPLDQRPPNPFTAGQPPSFKTNINRNKTRKWVQAKAFSYDGDDWGDYDEDDEYGVAAHASQNPQAPTGLRQRGQSVDKTGASRSFTEPVQVQAPEPGRRSSFDYGDDKRAFSASLNHAQTMPPPIDTSVREGSAAGKAPAVAAAPGAHPSQQVLSSSPQPYQEPESAQSRVSSTSWDPSVVSDSSAYQAPQLRRDFSVSALPPPLQMRPHNTSTPTAPQESPSSRFPPRKSSLSQASAEPAPAGDLAQSTPTASRQRALSNPNKPLPFIRPADIYKRVEQERRKASMDSERPSLDFATRPSQAELQSPGVRSTGSSDGLDRGHSPIVERYDGGRGQNLAPLETVAERKSEYLPEFSLVQAEKTAKAESQQATPSQSGPPQISALPDVPVSSFGADFWGSAEKPSTSSSSAQDLAEANEVLPQPEVGPSEEASLHHQPSHGFRTAVRNAFDRKDDNSVPPTPVSKSNSLSAGGSGVSRSNTDSTAGISPIMSRVPSGANPTSWKKDMENATPAIAEEPAVGSRPASSGTLLAHSRNGSGSSIPRIGTPTGRRPLGTPSPSQSPARSPFIESAKPVPAGESGELSGVSPLDPASPTNFATREADLVSSPSSNNKRTSANMGAEEKQAQTSFLEHQRKSAGGASPEHGSPVARAESPTKGRVRDLAGKFNDIVGSRRNSTQSISSIKSNGSANKRLSRSPSPTKETATERPQPGREASFRPKLPGTWESYSTVGQPSPDKERQEPVMESVQEREDMPPTKNNDALGEADITPTTAKHPVDHKDAVDPVHDPVGALAAAGAAIGESIKSTVAPRQRSPAKSEPESWEGSNASDEPPRVEEERKGRAVGDVYLRPLQLDRTASSIASSSGAPTPTANDGDREDYSPVKAPPPLMSSRSPSLQPPGLDSRGNGQASPEEYSPGPDTSDLATDRLTADIMKRLSTPSLVGSVQEANRSVTPQPPAQEMPQALQEENRASSVVPSEYEYYWAAGGEDASGGGSGHGAAPQTTVSDSTIRTVEPEGPPAPAGDSSSRAGLLTKKFSWEGQEGAGNAAAQASPAGAQAPAASKESAPTAPGADSSHFAAAQQSEDGPSVAKAIAELPDAPGLHSDGLHIVNPEPELDSSSASGVELEAPAAPNQPLNADAWRAQTNDVDPPSSQPSFTSAQPAPFGAAQQQEQRVPLFREILALKSPEERLAKYQQTREQFANMDTGLRNWVSTALANKPEHAELANLPKQPLPPIQSTHTSSGGGLMMRHKHNVSVSHFTTGFRKTSQTAAGLTSGPSAHDTISSPTDGGQSNSAGREKMQVRGKDLLKGAGVLGGKGMKEAKGLFAKGRSRFRGESKVD